MRYPHLDNNNSDFPYLDNVNVYQYDNDFDYERYDYDQMKITVCTVPWDMGEAHIGNRTISGIGNVVYFDSPDERNAWFDAIPDNKCFRYVTKYRQLHRENKISVDIPFDVASNYNYVAVEYMGLANDNSPVLNEVPGGRRHWFWFIREVEFVAPNSTVLHLLNDAWQTFIYDIDVSSMILERGHAPLNAVNVDTYLANPIENSSLLLAEDVDFGGESVVKTANYLPIGNGRKYCLFAIPMTQAAIIASGGAASGMSSGPTYADTGERWGYQLQVNGYAWEYGAGDYTSANLDITPLMSTDNVFNGNAIFAVKSENAQSFFDTLATSYVHVLNAIQAVFVVSEDYLKLGTAFTFHDVSVYPASKVNSTVSVDLTKAMFNYGSRYEKIAKLYTFPYAVLEFTDDEGNSGEIRIENTGKDLGIRKELSIAYPFVQYKAFVVGANGNKTIKYLWRNLANNANEEITCYEDDFSKFMTTYNIPTYALYIDAASADTPGTYADMQARRQAAIVNYQTTVRQANTAYENTSDSQDTARSNVHRSADTIVTNQSVQNQANTDITAENVSASTSVTAENCGANTDITGYNNTKINGDTGLDNNMTQILTSATNTALAATTAANNGCSTQLTNLGVMQNVGGAIGSAISMDIGGAVNSGISAYTAVQGNAIQVANANCCTGIQIGCNFTGAFVTVVNNSAKAVGATNCNSDTCSRTNSAATANTATTNAAMTANTATGNAAASTITSNSSTTMKANATDTETTETANADYTRDATVAGAKANLELRQLEESARWKAKSLSNPKVMTNYSGDALPECYKRRGVRLNVRTQPEYAIRAAGDEFLRYGYMLDKQWDFNGDWCVMKHFTYWKLKDFWIKGLNVPDMYVDKIRFFLYGGVTVWDKPESIGNVTIYENMN